MSLKTTGLEKFDESFKLDSTILETLRDNLPIHELNKFKKEVEDIISRFKDDLSENKILIDKTRSIASKNMSTKIKSLNLIRSSKIIIPNDLQEELGDIESRLRYLNDFSLNKWKELFSSIDSFKTEIEIEFSKLRKFKLLTKIAKILLPIFTFLTSLLIIPPPYGYIIGSAIAFLEYFFIGPKFESHLKKRFLKVYCQLLCKRIGLSLLNSMLTDINPTLEKSLIQSDEDLFTPPL